MSPLPIDAPQPRKVMPSVELDETEFKRRFLAQYIDPAFDRLSAELDEIATVAWDGYINSRKAPRTHKAGQGYANPEYELADDWVEAKAAIDAALRVYENPSRPSRVLVVNSASRSEHTCPGESSKPAIGCSSRGSRSSARRRR